MLANAPVVGQDAPMDFAAHGLLDGLEGEARAQRLALLTRLSEDGVTLEELTRAVNENRLALLPVDRLLGGRYTAREVEAVSGVSAELLLRVRRMQGLPAAEPDDRVFDDEDLAAASATRVFLDVGFDEERIIEISGVLGEAMSRVAATVTAAFASTFLHPGDGEDDVALRFAGMAERLTPAVAPILRAAFRANLRDVVARGMIGRAELDAGDLTSAQDLTIAFADVVGFTRLGGRVDVDELGMVAVRLARLSVSLVTPPVRLVKTIGDAAMFVSPDPAALVEVALALVRAFEEEQLPSLRAGIASGPALVRAGDYYGHPVNLASRVPGVARPGTVLCTREVHEAAAGAFEWSAAGRYRLKGVSGVTRLYRARGRGSGDGVKVDDEDERGVGGDL
jgi:adenylate cyclase